MEDPRGSIQICADKPRDLIARGFLCGKGVVTMKVVRIRGKNRIDVKKRVLDYYFSNREQVGGSMKEFFKRCTIEPSGKTVIYRGE